MRFRSVHSAHADWSVAVEECLLLLAQFAGDDRFTRTPNLGFLYLTDAFHPHAEQILTLLKTRTGIPNWVGAVGSAICAGTVEYTDEPAMAVMLGQFAPGSFNVFSGTQRPPALSARTDSGAEAAFTALVHADPGTPDLPDLVVDMAHKLSSGYLFGGVSSGRATLQIADRVLSGGLSGVVFASDVSLVSRVSQGVHPLPGAARHRITQANANLVLELDGRPAFDVLLEDAGIRARAVTADDLAREDFGRVRTQLQSLGRRGLFVGIEPEVEGGYRERTPRHDYLVRNVVAIDPSKGGVAVAAPVEEGQQLAFCTRDESAARKDLMRACSEIRNHLDELAEEGGEPVAARGAVYVSCLGRGSHLFGEQHEELRLIQRQLGEVPLVGFYANGEIGGRNLYGFTGVLTVFY